MFMESNAQPEAITGKLLAEKGLSVSLAESCTGGLVSSRLTDVSGSSAYIKLNVVTYSNDAKIKMLGIDAGLIEQYGAVSEPVAEQMALGIRKQADTDIGVGITGIAGPTGGNAEKPVGLVYIAISSEEHTKVYKINIDSSLSRKEIKYAASDRALGLLREFVEDIDMP